MEKFVYSFNEGSKDMRTLLGGKGANLSEMTKIGLPVPFGFTITTEACTRYYQGGCRIDEELVEQIFEKLSELENVTDKKYGDAENPLLLSVRSGSVISMPGMMDTILNLGINDSVAEGLAKLTGNERFAYDSYRRFIQMFSNVVLEIPKNKFEDIFEREKEKNGIKLDMDLTAKHLKNIICAYKKLIKSETGEELTMDPRKQLMDAAAAVFRSWNNEKAVLYRKLNNISSELGTAVNIQSMVFGNMDNSSGTGVAFTRNPVSGQKELFGEFLINAQGEDVVAGIRNPKPIANMAEDFPEIYKEFVRIAELLEKHFTDMQNMEFTVEKNKLFMLQSRNGKRSARAAVRIAVDMETEDLIDKNTAVTRLEPSQINQLLHPMFDSDEVKNVKKIVQGLPASPGAVTGKLCFNSNDAIILSAKGENVILVRNETSTDDLAGIAVSEGLLTSIGGMTSHAVVVARSMGKCCITGCSEILIDEKKKTLTVGGNVFSEKDYISLDGFSGIVYKGRMKTVIPEMSEEFATIMKWADEIRTLKIRANADNLKEAEQAIEFGAEGIGLCRTEHMFLEEEKIFAIQQLIFAEDEEQRRAALEKLFEFQKEDIKKIYMIMKDRPFTIRLIDPLMSEFLPHNAKAGKELAERMGCTYEQLSKRINSLKEFNPTLGHRGCRLTITYPDIAQMQAASVIMAAIEMKQEFDMDIVPEIMIPLVGQEKEFAFIKNVVIETINTYFKKYGITLNYLIGTMIEVPRAALTADEIAGEADFFSFGTNDLTQLTYGISREDSGKIVREYRNKLIFEDNPFDTIDKNGVGKLIKMAVELGRGVKPNIKMGLSGEQGGDARTVEFCHNIGLNYVSCAPLKVAAARLAAAQAAIMNPRK